jgi:anti-sigma regulatory factor (Ser/Thr protein kinase)
MSNTTVERARSTRARSIELRERSEELAKRLVDALRDSDARSLEFTGDTFFLRLARVRPAVALARHSLGCWLEQRGVAADRVHDLVLAASEACANAVEHPVASRDAAFELEANHSADEVTIVVRDFGRWRAEEINQARGRGLQLIKSLTTEVDVVRGTRGTEIVMRCRLD